MVDGLKHESQGCGWSGQRRMCYRWDCGSCSTQSWCAPIDKEDGKFMHWEIEGWNGTFDSIGTYVVRG